MCHQKLKKNMCHQKFRIENVIINLEKKICVIRNLEKKICHQKFKK
jgi:hypothetical protein